MPSEPQAHARHTKPYKPEQPTDRTAMTDLSKDALHLLSRRVIDVARSAGGVILDIYSSDYDVDIKSDQSPVTTADMAADAHIQAQLELLAPEIPVLSEESDQVPFTERTQWQTYWLVDPLDGTREFIKGNGEFSVNIALIHEKQPILGVVYAPVMDELYFAYHGGGAWKQSSPLEPARRIRVRSIPNEDPIVARSRARHAGPALRAFLDNLGEHEEVTMGSALKSCLVAEGSADLYPRLGPTSEWDTGAAQCIVTEAGGQFTDTTMRPLRYNTKDSLINPPFFVSGDGDRNWSEYLDEKLQ